MSDLEKVELTDRIKAMTEEEKLLAVKVIPTDVLWDELRRRDSANREMISGIRELVRVN